jgi:aspartyl-tRNA(Asn)/glutamyl-tRNA(Gln) amidotransferase subunit A
VEIVMTKIQSIKNADPIHYLEASTLAALISAKHLSSREVVRAYLDRTEAVNPKINAVVTLMGEAALKAADAADKAVASGAEIGPLHGVPFSTKDALDTAGVLTQCGSKLFAGNIPDKDATAVARFKAAGGIPLMKTNVPEFSAWTETDNLVTGRTNNPWNLERTPGGSSSGESAAIAAGMSPIGHRQRRHDFGAWSGRLHRHCRTEGDTWPRSLYWPLSARHLALVARRRNGAHGR